ncbi:TIGR01777 family oxidoreductase [Rossellomorea aquimaris]|uniref:TIGR01777 family oxidoreductase n=1 Tax=Rossellomorea aquimaris TaxID=189382 RepID=UPI001CD672AF|nr:TIGR01777 family oxidoreductase [Rossellomorea aquimaris]MCA1055621.1 TIGR01777 family oxidoreductase [Rossellomorea aquimaris]
MKIAITGGTGFVGQAVTAELLAHGHEVIILTRNPDKYDDQSGISYVKWLTDDADPLGELQGTEVFINLAGESINSGRWTDERKKRIINSRITSTREVIHLMNNLPDKPSCLVNASAIGYYPSSTSNTYTEASEEKASDFLGETVQIWEKEASKADDAGFRVVYTRFGIILGEEGGALPRMALPYKMFVGGTVLPGDQWMSWIHITDVAKSVRFSAEHDSISGPVNITAPSPLRMKDFGIVLGKVLGRPHWMPVPPFALKIAMGEMSQLVLEGQKVLPSVLLEHGFQFTYPELQGALENIYHSE